MPWNRNDHDPLAVRRRQLAEQERLLTEQRKRLTEQLQPSGKSSGDKTGPGEPPVWRMEEDARPERAVDPTPARKRNLALQRRRDMVLFFVCIVLFLIVLVAVLWVAYVHNIAPTNGV